MEAHDGADVVLLRVHHFLVIGLHQQGQGHPVRAEGRLDDVGNIVLVLLLVEIGEVLAGVLLVLAQVVIGAVRHAPQLAPAEGEEVLEVGGGLGVEGQLLGLVVPEAEVFLLHVQANQPVVAVGPPVLEPLQVRVGLAEEFQLHLLELPDAEDEVARGDFIAEALAHLAHAEGELPPGGPLNGGEVDEDALGGLGPEIDLVGGILGDALVGLEHQVELPDVGEVVPAAAGAGDFLFPDEGHQVLLGHGLHVHVQVILLDIALHQLVGPVPHLAGLAVDKGVVEGGDVAGGRPDLGIHEDGGVEADVVGVLLDEFFPPGPLDVVFQLHAQGAVVPAVGEAAVNLAAGEDEAPALAEGDDFFHALLPVVHMHSLLKNKTPRAFAGSGRTLTSPRSHLNSPLRGRSAR